jgi:hypothetical protein
VNKHLAVPRNLARAGFSEILKNRAGSHRPILEVGQDFPSRPRAKECNKGGGHEIVVVAERGDLFSVVKGLVRGTLLMI